MMFITFITYWSYETPWPKMVVFLYNFLDRKIYILGLFLFCFPLMLGNLYIFGGWLNSNIFLPLSKLSFSVYIIHPMLVKFVIFNVRAPIFFNGMYVFVLGFGLIVGSYVCAIFACLIFEMPFQNVRAIFKKKARGVMKKMEAKENLEN